MNWTEVKLALITFYLQLAVFGIWCFLSLGLFRMSIKPYTKQMKVIGLLITGASYEWLVLEMSREMKVELILISWSAIALAVWYDYKTK